VVIFLAKTIIAFSYPIDFFFRLKKIILTCYSSFLLLPVQSALGSTSLPLILFMILPLQNLSASCYTFGTTPLNEASLSNDEKFLKSPI
jgi:hypothetical protein